MPKISVNEDGETDAGEAQIGCAENAAVVAAKLQSKLDNRDCQNRLGFCAALADGPHYPGPGFRVEHVHVPQG